MRKVLFSLVMLALAFSAFGGTRPVHADAPVLYGVTGDGGKNSETLFKINHRTGATQLFLELGEGDDGEEIAFSPRNGRLLHASGNSDRILEWINPATKAVTPIGGSDCDEGEISALTYVGGVFLAGTIDSVLCEITNTGSVNKIATIDLGKSWPTGLAWVGGKLYMTVQGTNTSLMTIDPDSGDIESVRTLNVDASVYRFTALAAHPCTRQLYASMATESEANSNPSSRSLVTINPSSGKVTVVGNLGGSFAGLAFVGDDCDDDDDDERTPPALGGLAGALTSVDTAQENRARANAAGAATAAAAQATPPTAAVRPPSTGDAGLEKDQGTNRLLLAMSVATASILLTAAYLRARRYR